MFKIRKISRRNKIIFIIIFIVSIFFIVGELLDFFALTHKWEKYTQKESVSHLNEKKIVLEIDRLLSTANEKIGFSGSLIVVKDDTILLRKIYSNHLETPKGEGFVAKKYRVGSLSKQFTAMLVMILQERKMLTVNDSACGYIKKFCHGKHKNITIHHLLTHTSGIQKEKNLLSFYLEILFRKAPRYLSLDSLIDEASKASLLFDPGFKFSYSNLGYQILTKIIQMASGETYDSFLKKNILNKLGMSETGVAGQDNHEKIPLLAESIMIKKSLFTKKWQSEIFPPTIHYGSAHGAGSIYSTVDDLLKWDRAIHSGKLLSPLSSKSYFSPEKMNYAYGTMVENLKGSKTKIHWHNGMVQSYYSKYVHYLDSKLTFIFLSNTYVGFGDIDKIRRCLHSLLVEKRYCMII